ncbi:MAG: DUF6265 family protein [Planctomycetota bacterium]
MKRLGVGLLLTAVLLGAAGVVLSGDEGEGAKKGVADLAWMAGRWRSGAESGDGWEETWGPPSADSMTGMSRLLVKGKTKLYEFMVIEEEPDGLVFRMFHYNRGLVGWDSEKEGPLTYSAVELSGRRMVLRNPKKEFPRDIVYERTEEGLEVHLKGTRDGEASTVTFRFTLAKE